MDTGHEGTDLKNIVQRVMRRVGASVVCGSLALLGVVGLLLAGSLQRDKSDARGNARRVSDAHSGTTADLVLPDADNLSRTFRAAAKPVLPAVVVVKTSSKPHGAAIPLDGMGQFSDMSFQDVDKDQQHGANTIAGRQGSEPMHLSS